MAQSMRDELRDPPSPASIVRMASEDDTLWDRMDFGTDMQHSGPVIRRSLSILGRGHSDQIKPAKHDTDAENVVNTDGHSGESLQNAESCNDQADSHRSPTAINQGHLSHHSLPQQSSEESDQHYHHHQQQQQQQQPQPKQDAVSHSESPNTLEAQQPLSGDHDQKQKQIYIASHIDTHHQQKQQQLLSLHSGQIVDFEDTPRYLRREFILSGYYVGGSHLKSAYRTLLGWNNETLNAWTMVAGVLVTWTAWSYGRRAIPQPDPVYGVMALSALPHAPFSISLHAMIGVSERTRDVLRTLDVVFILTCGVPRGLAMAWFVFQTPLVFRAYAAVIIVNWAHSVVSTCIRRRIKDISKAQLAKDVTGAVLFYLVPVGFSASVELLNRGHPGVEGALLASILTLLYVAAWFYSRHLPERWRPGMYDLCGNSHQIMHLLIAGEIRDFDPGVHIDKKSVRRLDKAIKYLMVAGKKALLAAGLGAGSTELADIDVSRAGIIIGSALGGMNTFASAIEAIHTQGYRKMNPFCIPFSIHNMGGALLAMDLGFMGPNYPINTACATGNYCLLNAAQHIERGDADLMLAGGTEAAIIPSGIGGFIACKALSKRNSDPAAASRPWDKGRDGFVMGEGAGVLVLEELGHAQSRGANILAEFIGGAIGSDAYHLTDPRPDGSGVRACIEKALSDTGVSPSDVNYVNAHATSTSAGDLAEYRAITEALGEGQLCINSTKSMTGHLLGAAAAVEAIAAVQAIITGKVHPNINLTDPEDAVDTTVLIGPTAQPLDIKVALSNSFGFGGHNSCVMFKAFEG